MTEAAFQACRNVMQRANWIRGKITDAKGEVAKWTSIEATNRNNLQHTKADGAKKMLDKAMIKLDDWRKKLDELSFPDPNLQSIDTRCEECGMKLKVGKSHVCHEY
jgi:hypothetical protein